MVKCIRCGNEYHVDKMDRGRKKVPLYVLHCKNCGHLLQRRNHKPDPSDPTVTLEDSQLLGDELREFESKQAKHDYEISERKKWLERDIFDSNTDIKYALDKWKEYFEKQGYSEETIEKELKKKKGEVIENRVKRMLKNEEKKRIDLVNARDDLTTPDKRDLKQRIKNEIAQSLDSEVERVTKKFDGDEEKREKRKEEEEKLEEAEFAEKRKKHAGNRLYDKIHNKLGGAVMKGFTMAAFVGIGVVLSSVFGLWWFFVAFLSFGLYFTLPNPDDMDIKTPKHIEDKLKELAKEQVDNNAAQGYFKYYIEMAKAHWLNKESPRGASFSGGLRSLTKLTGFVCLIWGLKLITAPFITIILVAVCFIAYYSFKVSFDPKKGHEIVESVIRFALAIFIAISIFVNLFDSWVLGLIAFAFFAVPPIPSGQESEEVAAINELLSKGLFVVAMVLALFGFFIGWGGASLPTAMMSTFIYFWVICGISGFFSNAEARPGMGFLMLGAATIIYGIGPGQQELMSALFGDWWPTIQNSLTAIGNPLSEAFSGLGNTFSSGWLLMTNPVGYATQLMNGSHADNPLGKTGAYGIELQSFTVGQIFPEQPFLASLILKNDGAFEAKDVRIFLSVNGGDAPTYKSWILFRGNPQDYTFSKFDATILNIRDLMSEENCIHYDERNCIYTDGSSEYFNGPNLLMGRQYISQYAIQGEISCDVINKFDLRSMAIPLTAKVVYDYQSDSTLDVEFMSEDEWNRLARINTLDSKMRLIESTHSSAPVKFPMGTAGLKNPILSTQAFHISMMIDTDKGTKSMIEHVQGISFEYPAEWTLIDCTPSGKEASVSAGTDDTSGTKTVVWDFSNDPSPGSKTIICNFKALGDERMGNAPTKTYTLRAHANYTFSEWKSISTRIQFGGLCCDNTDCPTGYVCNKTSNSCRPKETDEIPETPEGGKIGEDCTAEEPCEQSTVYYKIGETDVTYGKLHCRETDDRRKRICCPENVLPGTTTCESLEGKSDLEAFKAIIVADENNGITNADDVVIESIDVGEFDDYAAYMIVNTKNEIKFLKTMLRCSGPSTEEKTFPDSGFEQYESGDTVYLTGLKEGEYSCFIQVFFDRNNEGKGYITDSETFTFTVNDKGNIS